MSWHDEREDRPRVGPCRCWHCEGDHDTSDCARRRVTEVPPLEQPKAHLTLEQLEALTWPWTQFRGVLQATLERAVEQGQLVRADDLEFRPLNYGKRITPKELFRGRLPTIEEWRANCGAVTVTPASAPYPGAEVHRWIVTTRLQDPNGCEAAEADAAVARAVKPLVGSDDWAYASGRAGSRWAREYDYHTEADVWRCEVRRV